MPGLTGGILTHRGPIDRLRLLVGRLHVVVALMPRLGVLSRRHLLVRVCPAKIGRLRRRERFEILRYERFDLRWRFEVRLLFRNRLLIISLLFLFLSGVWHQLGPLTEDTLRLSFDRASHHLFERVNSFGFSRLEMLSAPFHTGVCHLFVLIAAANIDLTALFGLVTIQ